MYRLVLAQGLVILTLLFQGTACFSQDSLWNTYMESGTEAFKQGKYQDARASFASAVKESEKFGAQDPRLGVSCSYLALMNKKLGDLAQAELLYKRAVSIFEHCNGPNDSEVATNLEGLAAVYHAQGKDDQCEPLYKRALDISEKAFGPEHPRVSQSLVNLATLYRDQRRYGEAEPLYKRAESIDRKKLDPRLVLFASVANPADADTLVPLSRDVASFVLRSNPSLMEKKGASYSMGKELGALLREVHETGGSRRFDCAGCTQGITLGRDADGTLTVTMLPLDEKQESAERSGDKGR